MAGQSAKKTGKRPSNTGSSGSPAVSFTNEVVLWIVLAVSIILFISNFGIAGKAGSFISSIFFGLFGLTAYVFPILLFAGTAFIISNKDNTIAAVKAAAAIVFVVFICMFLELIGGDSLAKSPLDSYLWAAEHKYGGGFTGGLLTWLIRPNLGTVSAYVIDIIVLIICLVLITERSLWKRIESGGIKMYRTAKNETKRQRQQHMERRQRRMDNKVAGVSLDTDIKNTSKPEVSDAVSELHPNTVFVPDFPIHFMGEAEPQQTAAEPVQFPKQGDAEPVQFPQQTAVGMDFSAGVIAFPDTAFPDAALPEDAGSEVPVEENEPSYLDNIIPITNQKVVLQPNLTEDETDKEPSLPEDKEDRELSPMEEAEDILAKTSALFSEMLPDIMETALEETGTAQSAKQNAVPQGMRDAGMPAVGMRDIEMPVNAGPAVEMPNAAKPAAEMQDAAEPAVNMPNAAAPAMGTSSVNMPDAAMSSVDMQQADLHNNYEDDEEFEAPFATAEELMAQQLQSANTAARESEPQSAAYSVPEQRTAAEAAQGTPAAAHRNPKQKEPQAEIDSNAAEIDMQLQQAQLPVKREYIYPAAGLLKPGNPNQTGDSRQHLQETALKLQQILKNFGVNVTILNVSCGPSVTRYEIQPEMGVKVSKIVNLADDIKLNLAAADIRIEAPIPGKAAIGIEVPNKETVPVMFRDLIEAEDFQKQASPCAFAVGKDIAGQAVVTDICKMPHLLIAGATGSGKSVCINTIIMSILYKADPEDVKMIMVDPKVVELSVYNGIPHLLLPVVTDPKKAAGALHWAVSEMMERYQKFANYGVRNIKGYNAKIKQIEHIADENKPQKMPYIVIIVDELADLMMAAPGDVEDAICRLAQLARAAGIHLIIATQRPSVNVITGLIKANMPSRIAFSVSSGIDSRTILDMVGAEKLLGKGDMLFYPQGYQKPVRVQGAFVSDSEVSKVVEFLSEQNGAAQYSSAVEEKVANAASGSGAVSIDSAPENDRDAYFADAAKLLIDKDKASVSMLQRYFKIGFNRAARIMDQLEEAGVVGPEEGTKPRKILMSPEEFEQYTEEVL